MQQHHRLAVKQAVLVFAKGLALQDVLVARGLVRAGAEASVQLDAQAVARVDAEAGVQLDAREVAEHLALKIAQRVATLYAQTVARGTVRGLVEAHA